MKFIAIVPVLVVIDGERVEIPPGEEVPGLHPTDVAYLKANDCIYEEEEKAAAEKAKAKAEKSDGKEFLDARKAVQAGQEAIAPAAK